MRIPVARPGLPRQLVAYRGAQLSALGLALAIVLGTILLMLPQARTGAPPWPELDHCRSCMSSWLARLSFPGGAPLSAAFFTAVSATTVTGLIVVDTSTYWSDFGQGVLMFLFEIGGIGTMTLAALLAIVISKRLNLRQRFEIASATGSVTIRDVRMVVVRIVRYSLGFQLFFAIFILIGLLRAGEAFPYALKHASFLSVSAFNNAGFAPYPDNLISYATHPWVLLPLAALIILGGIGFPVLIEVRRLIGSASQRKWGQVPWHWSLTSKLMLVGTPIIIALSWLGFAALEWNNPATLGQMIWQEKLLASFFSAVSPRTAGFNCLDIAQQSHATWLLTDVLMFIGAGPVSTAGGVKITTILVLFYIVHVEIRSGGAVQILGRRIGRSVHRQAVTVLLMAFAFIITAVWILMMLTDYSMDQLTYEAVSAASTVGLSTGITEHLPISAQMVVCVLMFVGRLGPVTLASALAMRPINRAFDYPKERPLIG